MPKIIIYHQGKKKVHEFGQEGFSVGRSPENQFVSSGQKSSRNHCKLVVEDDTVKVVDLDSRNGTFVNGKRVKDKALEAGDAVKAGDVVFFFETEEGGKSGMAKCPSCFNMVPKDVKKCEHCGEDMEEDLPFVPRCAVCQKEQEHDGRFCAYCGAELKTGKAPDACVRCQQVLLDKPELCPECGLSPYPPSEDEIEAQSVIAIKEAKKQKAMYVTLAVVCAAAGYALAYFVPVPTQTKVAEPKPAPARAEGLSTVEEAVPTDALEEPPDEAMDSDATAAPTEPPPDGTENDAPAPQTGTPPDAPEREPTQTLSPEKPKEEARDKAADKAEKTPAK